MKADMTIDGVSFMKDWAKEHTEAEFMAQHSHHFEGPNQTERLKAAYAKLNPPAEPEALPVVESKIPNKKV